MPPFAFDQEPIWQRALRVTLSRPGLAWQPDRPFLENLGRIAALFYQRGRQFLAERDNYLHWLFLQSPQAASARMLAYLRSGEDLAAPSWVDRLLFRYPQIQMGPRR